MFRCNSFLTAIFPLQLQKVDFVCGFFPFSCVFLSFSFFSQISPVVVAQAYKVDVEVLAASRGCSAILRCVIPTFVKELVRVVSWVQEPSFYIYPSLQGGNTLIFRNKIMKTTRFLFKAFPPYYTK